MTIKESSNKSKTGAADQGPVLIFMRHGTRSFEGDALSDEGKHQAALLSKTFVAKNLPLPNLLESSPKKRTQATLAAIATELGLRVQVDRRLDERTGGETQDDFEIRVKKFLQSCDEWGADEAATTPSVMAVRVLCSHLDWLEAATLFINSDENDFERSEPWPPLAVRAYQYHDGIWKRRKA